MTRRILFSALTFIILGSLFAQTPQGIGHQAVIRDAEGKLVTNANIGVRVSILQGEADGIAVYSETHALLSNANGLVTYVIGKGTVLEGEFAEIDWAQGLYFLKTEVDPGGGTNYSIAGTTQFHWVPYAMHSRKAETSQNAVVAETLSDGSSTGEILYWNGTNWVAIPPGEYGQTLNICNGIPTWGPCPPSVPVVTTLAVSEITANSATSGGNLIQPGSSQVSDRGLVWSTTTNPTVSSNQGSASSGSGTGTFSVNITGLTPETEYFVRAYATNSEGTAYGNQVSFTTEAATVFKPTVTTNAISEITQTSAVTGGEITSDGGAAVTARGVVYATTSTPNLENNTGFTSDGTGMGSFTSDLTGLTQGTNYYVRAYAVNSQGVSYGQQRIFRTQQDANLPTVVTFEATDITQTSAKVGGEVVDSGSGEVLLKGIMYGRNENPTFQDNFTEEGTGIGVFTSTLSGLDAGKTYYARAYATSSIGGIAYGEQIEFSTNTGIPSVSILSLNSGQPGFRKINAEVTSDGGAEVTARGFVWDIETEPTLEGNEGFNTEGNGEGSYTSILTGLSPNTHYNIRAYATNSEGTSYSEEFMFNFWDYHGTVTDFDGNIYNTVMIGNQEWVAENLKTTSYRNGIPITTGLSGTQWEANTTGAYAWFDNNIQWKVYGALYNWYAVNNSNKLCPSGWKVPSDADWLVLTDYIATNHNDYYYSDDWDNNIGKALKSCRQGNSPLGGECATWEHPRWISHDVHYGVDEYGFSALPGAHRFISGSFFGIGERAFWWSATEHSITSAWFRRILHGENSMERVNFDGKTSGHSIRCVKD